MPRQYTPRIPIKIRLLTKGVRDGECLLWPGSVDRGGYGLINYERRTQKVHIVSYRVFVGPIPKGLQVQHSCNIRRCYEPTHLSVGTGKQNIEYAVSLGRMASGARNGKHTKPERTPKGDRHWTRLYPERLIGEKNPRAVLTPAIVREVRARRANGESARSLATGYGVGLSTVKRVLRGESWTHI